jgi:hypothetical protein
MVAGWLWPADGSGLVVAGQGWRAGGGGLVVAGRRCTWTITISIHRPGQRPPATTVGPARGGSQAERLRGRWWW